MNRREAIGALEIQEKEEDELTITKPSVTQDQGR